LTIERVEKNKIEYTSASAPTFRDAETSGQEGLQRRKGELRIAYGHVKQSSWQGESIQYAGKMGRERIKSYKTGDNLETDRTTIKGTEVTSPVSMAIKKNIQQGRGGGLGRSGDIK